MDKNRYVTNLKLVYSTQEELQSLLEKFVEQADGIPEDFITLTFQSDSPCCDYETRDTWGDGGK